MWSQFGRPRHSSRRVGQKQMDENFLEKIKNYSCFPRFSFDGCTISTADQEMALIKHNVTPFARQASSPSWRWRLWIRTGPALSHSSFSFSFFPFWSKKGGCGFVVNRQARHAIATHLHIARRCTLAARKRLAKKKKTFSFFFPLTPGTSAHVNYVVVTRRRKVPGRLDESNKTGAFTLSISCGQYWIKRTIVYFFASSVLLLLIQLAG